MIKLNNGYKIPKIGLGTFLMTESEAKEVIPLAIETGYRLFDTAQMYDNEKALGKALKKSNLKREEYYIVSKLMYHHNENKTEEFILKSLKDLQTDYLDLFLIHWPNHDNKINLRTWKVLEKFYEKGVFKAIGVSNFTRYQLLELLKEAKVKPAVNQIEMHPLLNQEATFKFLKEKDIQLMGYGPFARGNIFKSPYKEAISEIGDKYNLTVAQAVVAWGANRNIIMIPKTVTKSRLDENFKAASVKLSQEDILKINSLNRGRRFYTDPANTIHGDLKTD